jgi:hypothetical protein
LSEAKKVPRQAGAMGWFDVLRRSIPIPYARAKRIGRADVAAAFVAGIVAAALSIYVFNLVDPRIYDDPVGFNVWFEADAPRALGAMENRDPKYHGRNEVHPLFSLLSVPVIAAIKLIGITGLQSAMVLILEEYRHTQIRNGIWSPIDNLRAIIVSSAVAPAPYVAMHSGPGQTIVPIVDNQTSDLLSFGPVGVVERGRLEKVLGARNGQLRDQCEPRDKHERSGRDKDCASQRKPDQCGRKCGRPVGHGYSESKDTA